MQVTVLAVGRARGDVAAAAVAYEERARHYWKLDSIDVASGAGGSSDPTSVRVAEGERIRGRLPDGAHVVALTRGGRGLSSDALARWMGDLQVRGVRRLVFVVGGAFGLDASVLQAADRTLSLSTMTLPHDVARLVLMEQIYRAGTILRGEPYHKGVT